MRLICEITLPAIFDEGLKIAAQIKTNAHQKNEQKDEIGKRYFPNI
jgi:hypothetical protein